MPDGQPLPLDVVHAQGGRVEQQVDKVIMEQVHLVDVEQAAVRGREQARLERGDPVGQRALDVQRAGQPVLGGADGQLGQPGRPGQPRGLAWMRAIRAAGVGRGRVAAEPAVRDDVNGGQQRRQPAHHRRLRGAFLAPHQHAADGRRDGVKQQRELQVGHADDGGEGIGLLDRGRKGSRPARAVAIQGPGRSQRDGGLVVAGVRVPGRAPVPDRVPGLHPASSFPGFRARSWSSRWPESPGSRIDARPRRRYRDPRPRLAWSCSRLAPRTAPRSQLRDSPGFPPGSSAGAIGLTAWHNRPLSGWRMPVRRYTGRRATGMGHPPLLAAHDGA